MPTQNPKNSLQKILQQIQLLLKTMTNPLISSSSFTSGTQYKNFIHQILYYLKYSDQSMVFDTDMKELIRACTKMIPFCGGIGKYQYCFTLFRFLVRKCGIGVKEEFYSQRDLLFNCQLYQSNKIDVYPLLHQQQPTPKPNQQSPPPYHTHPTYSSQNQPNPAKKTYKIKITPNNTSPNSPITITKQFQKQLQMYILCGVCMGNCAIILKYSRLLQNVGMGMGDLCPMQGGRICGQLLIGCIQYILANIIPKCQYQLQILSPTQHKPTETYPNKQAQISIKVYPNKNGKFPYIHHIKQNKMCFYCLDQSQQPRQVKVGDLYGMLYRRYWMVKRKRELLGKDGLIKEDMFVCNIQLEVEMVEGLNQFCSQQNTHTIKSATRYPTPRQQQQQPKLQPQQSQTEIQTEIPKIPPMPITQPHNYPHKTLLLTTNNKHINKYTQILHKNNQTHSIYQPVQHRVHNRYLWVLQHEGDMMCIKILLKLCEQEQQIKIGSIRIVPITTTLLFHTNTNNPNTSTLLNKLQQTLTTLYNPSSYTITQPKSQPSPISQPSQTTILSFSNNNQSLHSYIFLRGYDINAEFINSLTQLQIKNKNNGYNIVGNWNNWRRY